MKKTVIISLLLTSIMANSFGALFSVFLNGQSSLDLSTVTWTISGADADGIPDSDDEVQVRMFNCPNINIQNSTAFSCDDFAFIFLTPPGSAIFNVNGEFTAAGDINLNNTSGLFIFPNFPINIGGSFTNTTGVGTFFDFGTVRYNGNTDQSILPVNYGVLELSGTGNKKLQRSGATSMTVGTFTPNTSTIEFDLTTGTQVLPVIGDYYNVLLSGQDKELGANFVVTNNLEVNTSLQLSTKSFDLAVGGNLTLNGDIVNDGNETVTFNGASATVVSGSQTLNSQNIIINKNASATAVTLNSPVEIESNGVITVTKGALNANGNLTLLSTVSPIMSARLAEVDVTNASVTGNMTVERFIPSNSSTGKFWWHIGSPLSGVAVSQLQDDFPITGTFTGSNTLTGSANGQSMRTYDETNPSTALKDGWVDFPASTNSDAMTVGKGYRVFVRNTISTTVTDLKADITGTATTGDFPFNVSYTSSGTPLSDGWNFVSNPYPSPIDWDNANWVKTNIEPTAFVWDAKQKTYRSVTSGNGDIPSFQGFWVQANSASSSLIVKEACKTSSTQAFSRIAKPENQLEIAVIDKNPNDLYNTAITYVSFNNNASEKKDQFDVNQLGRNFANETWEGATLLDIATKNTDNYVFRENFLPVTNAVTEVPLTITFNEGSEYGFEFHRHNFSENTTIVLKDKYLNTEEEINEHSYLGFKVDGNLASKASDRFSLLISSKPLASVEAIIHNSEMKVFPNPTSSNSVEVSGVYTTTEASIVISDMNGVAHSEIIAVPTNGQIVEKIDLEGLTKGVYLLSIKTDNDMLTQKIIVE